jgi:phage gp36-like protein
MGDFITKTDMEAKYQLKDLVALTNNDGSNATTINDDVMNNAIDDAESVIKGYVQTKYSLPFTTVPVPRIIKDIAKVMTYYKLHERKTRITPQLQAIYDNSIKILDDIANGVASLDTTPGANGFQTGDAQKLVDVTWVEAPFNDTNLTGYI